MLYVVRHGRTAANAAGELLGHRDPELDDVGRAQAAALASVLPAGARVVSSPLRRCRQTAEAFADQIEVDERLKEMNYGDFEGVPVAGVPAETWATWRSDPGWAPPGGESHQQLAERVWALLDELRPSIASNDIVLVSHVSPIKAVVAWALGVPIDISWRCFVSQASILTVGFREGTPSLRSFNEIAHLATVATEPR